jgi:hypothetical protein
MWHVMLPWRQTLTTRWVIVTSNHISWDREKKNLQRHCESSFWETAAQESNFTRSAQVAVTPAAYAPPSYVQYVLQHHQLRQQQQCRGSEQTWPARWSIGASDSGARTYGCCYIQYSTVSSVHGTPAGRIEDALQYSSHWTSFRFHQYVCGRRWSFCSFLTRERCMDHLQRWSKTQPNLPIPCTHDVGPKLIQSRFI